MSQTCSGFSFTSGIFSSILSRPKHNVLSTKFMGLSSLFAMGMARGIACLVAVLSDNSAVLRAQCINWCEPFTLEYVSADLTSANSTMGNSITRPKTFKWGNCATSIAMLPNRFVTCTKISISIKKHVYKTDF